MAYHAFMSYSHAADGRLAPALHAALHGFAKPWYRLRALHVFRDKTTLHPTPRLWPAIQSALDGSEHFILLASPEAADSQWVQREIKHWLDHRGPERLLIVLTGGTLEWNDDAGGFDPQTEVLPGFLLHVFAEEPLYLDLTWAKDENDLSLRNPRFREAVAEIAAPLHGRPKDELSGEDVRQYRRTRRLAGSAIAGLALLAIASIVAAFYAFNQRDVAEFQRTAAVEQSRIALSRQLAAQSTTVLTQVPDRLPLSVLLALESTRLHPSFEGNQALRSSLALLPHAAHSFAYPPIDRIRGRVRALAFSPDRKYLAVARDDGSAGLFDLLQGKQTAVLQHQENPGAVFNVPGGGISWKAPGVDAEMTSVAFSADGRFVATGSNDKTARVWETTNAREILRLVHEGPVSSVAFHPVSGYLATGGKDGVARIFEVATGPHASQIKQEKERHTDPGTRDSAKVTQLLIESRHSEEVREVAFSPDGRYLAAISTRGELSLLNVATREVHRRWHTGGISGLGLTFSADGKKLATTTGDFVFVWDVESGKQIFRATHAPAPEDAGDHLTWIDDVAFDPDGKHLATGGRDGTARVWILANGQERIRLKHASRVETVAFGRDSDTLCTGSFDGARLWDIPAGRERLRAAGANEIVAFSPDGSRVASGGSDANVSVWHSGRGDQLARMVHPDEVSVVAFSPDGKRLATASKKGVHLWSFAGERQAESKEPAFGMRALMFSHDGRSLAAGGRSPYLFVMDVAEGLARKSLATSSDANDYLLSPRYIAAEGENRRHVLLWETSGGRELARIENLTVAALKFDPTGTFLVVKGLQQRGQRAEVRVWALAENREIGRSEVKDSAEFALGPRGQLLALSGYEQDENKHEAKHHVDVWNVATATAVSRLPHADVVAFVTFDTSGERLLTIAGNFRGQQREISVWNLQEKKVQARLNHEEQVDAVRLSPDGEVVATLSAGRAYVWSISTGELLSQFAEAGHFRAIRFNPDGRHLLTGSSDGTAAVWLWKTEDLRVEACRRLATNLTVAEWDHYLGATPYRKSCPDISPDQK